MMEMLICYLLAINVITFTVFGLDKWKARRGRWRIPENTLLTFTLVGGSAGAWLGMKVWHHKTLHGKFRYGVPALLLIHMAAIVCFIR